MSSDPYDRHSIPSCTYLDDDEQADIDDGPDPPKWSCYVAFILAAVSIGLHVARLLP